MKLIKKLKKFKNNLIYNIHLLTGKISQPGNGPFSLTGQPSACGTAREVGTFTHKLPHGVVMNKKDREMAARIWKVPVEKIPSKPTYHATEMFRAVDRGEIKFIWTQATNPLVSLPKTGRYRPAMEKESPTTVSASHNNTMASFSMVLPFLCCC